MKNIKKYKVRYSILSRGSEEKGGFKGYIWIGENNKKWVITQDEHGVTESISEKGILKCHSKKEIKKIAIARFQLMAAIMIKKNKSLIKRKSNILVAGLGNVGLGTIFELLKIKRKNITIFLRNNNKKSIIDEINNKYRADIKIINNVDDLKKFDTIIDTTGNIEVLDNILNSININTNLILMGTPRDGLDINLLFIHRKNIRIIGAHEINGISEKERQKLFTNTLKYCSKINLKSLNTFISIHKYTKSIVDESIQDRSHIIHIFDYKEE